MKVLEFLPVARTPASLGSKRVRTARFSARSCFPVSAACVVANAVRETLSSLLGTAVSVRLLEPSIPTPHAWRAIAADALLYRVCGRVVDAALVLRMADAIAFAAAAFGEPPTGVAKDRTLSPMERDVVERIVGATAPSLASVCGARDGIRAERVPAIDGFVTYFEVSVEEPVGARIGVAVSRDPSPEPRGALDLGHLSAVPVTVRAGIDLGRVSAAAALASLAPGKIVTLRRAHLDRCDLLMYGRRVARGSCGVRNGRYALSVG